MKSINEYLPILVAIPTLLGGFWQLIQLLIISPAFLRFFSLSQLISDGLFIGLMTIFAIIIPHFLAVKTLKYLVKQLSFQWILKIAFVNSSFQFLIIFTSLEKSNFILYTVISAFLWLFSLELAINEKNK